MTTSTRRKLNLNQKRLLAKHAYAKFIDKGLRAEEVAARERVVREVMLLAKGVTASDLKVLRKYKMTRFFKTISVPNSMSILSNFKTHVLPNNKTVERGEYVTVYQPCDWEPVVPTTIKDAVRGFGRNNYGRHFGNLKLPKTIELPCYDRSHFDEVLRIVEGSMSDKTCIVGSQLMNASLKDAMKAYFKKADDRFLAEMALAKAASRLISASTHYSQVLDFWPEAKEIENDLFYDTLPSAVSLVTISDQDKRALCSNMQSRGVAASAMCTTE